MATKAVSPVKHLRVACPAPNFKAKALMPDGTFAELTLNQFRKKYVLLYFYPMDFTFVCPSEILAFDRAVGEFHRKNVQLLGCSVDSHYAHYAWTQTSKTSGGLGGFLKHPLLSDITKEMSKNYQVLLDDGSVSLRGLFLIDKEGVVRHQTVNDLPLGRSVEESLRIVDALQYFEKNGEVCPANWKQGDPGIKPTQEGIKSYLARVTTH